MLLHQLTVMQSVLMVITVQAVLVHSFAINGMVQAMFSNGLLQLGVDTSIPVASMLMAQGFLPRFG